MNTGVSGTHHSGIKIPTKTMKEKNIQKFPGARIPETGNNT